MKILYEDKYCIAISKPCSVHVQPTGNPRDIAVSEIYRNYFLVHRLDSHTSGVLLLAKSKYVASRFSEMFRSKRISKKYIALSLSLTSQKIQTLWTDRLQKTKKGKAKIVSSGGLLAQTKVHIEPLGKRSLLTLHPQTGRMHQLRVQAATHGFPILGDPLYGKILHFPAGGYAQDVKGRMFLHAHSLEFTHPYTRKKLIIVDPIPKDFFA